ncbi:IS5 family transposase [Gammaproteobacteria bacterium 2W06]|nr:IS5 family transposase [Gammaproteobacteria bacterium 2W06]
MHPQVQNRVVFIPIIPTDDRQQPQKGPFEFYLQDMINLRHPGGRRMAERIDWQQCEEQCGLHWCLDNGRPGHMIRLHFRLQMLKHMQVLSDRELLDQWVDNPHWQYLCGELVFQHEPPMDESTMGRFRQRMGERC